MTISEYNTRYPWQKMILKNGKVFEYRYHKHPTSKTTLVLLTGGIGLSNLFYLHFEAFSKAYSVITFDYQIQFATQSELADACAELFERLGVKVWLVGQSLGGIVAQIIAKRHPKVVDGLILSNTCSLAQDMPKEAYDQLIEMATLQEKRKFMIKLIPFGLFKRMLTNTIMKKRVSTFTENEKQLMAAICDELIRVLSKPYELHMIDLLADVKNHLTALPSDFAHLQGKVLLLLSEDDDTFNTACKQSLIQLMPEPKVITNLTGGHLALLVKVEQYATKVQNFINSSIQ